MSLFKSSEIIELTPNDYKNGKFVNPKLLHKNGMVVISASWCGYCQQLKPVYLKVAKTMGAIFPMCNIDAVKYPDFAKKLGVTGYPTIYNISNGKIQSKYTDERTYEAMLKNICTKSLAKCKNI